ncbi:Histone H1 [Verticillium dahliae VDG1]|nr:Histone H1 [Verticillium dahliae VDG1]
MKLLARTLLPLLRPLNGSPLRWLGHGAARSQALSTTLWTQIKQMPQRPKPPPDSDIEESYLKGSGPGGQKIKLDDLENGDQSRNAIVAEAKRRKAASAAKKSKRKYRKLEEAGRHNGQPGDNVTVAVAPETGTSQVQVPTNIEKTNPTDGKSSDL